MGNAGSISSGVSPPEASNDPSRSLKGTARYILLGLRVYGLGFTIATSVVATILTTITSTYYHSTTISTTIVLLIVIIAKTVAPVVIVAVAILVVVVINTEV